MDTKKEIIVFDLDGTLINSAPDLCYALNQTLSEINIPEITLQEVMGYLGDGALELIKRGITKYSNIKNFDTELLRLRFLEIYDNCLLNKTDFYPNVLQTLKDLKKMDFTLAICTNKPELLAKRIINGLNGSSFFDIITGGDTYEFRKPDPRHLINTILETGKKVEAAIMIGDSDNDINCAKKANIPSIAVNFGYSKVPVESLNPDLVMSDYINLTQHIEDIKKK
jgi:phosphoglycolate phosphatase|tara:strand:+ start:418 stop:1092 length:675 start_codon:yes stop_codon:yes gene_type:complete